MPGGDRTGPLGMGSRSGRAAGYCAGFEMPGYTNPAPWPSFGMGFGRGRGFGGGGGRGWRHWFYATGQPAWSRFSRFAAPYRESDPEIEKRALRSQAQALEMELKSIKKRLSKFDGGIVAE